MRARAPPLFTDYGSVGKQPGILVSNFVSSPRRSCAHGRLMRLFRIWFRSRAAAKRELSKISIGTPGLDTRTTATFLKAPYGRALSADAPRRHGGIAGCITRQLTFISRFLRRIGSTPHITIYRIVILSTSWQSPGD
jgi:hypothetical protein